MKQNKSLFVCCLLLILSSTASIAQPYAQYPNSAQLSPQPYWDYYNQVIVLRSDQPSQSVLVSNILADKTGDMSPVIGAALWTYSGRQLECRSLLKFNYNMLPGFIIENPSLITSAQLILFPLKVSFAQDDMNKPSSFIVRRVKEKWEDSAATWINQPSADSSATVTKVIKVKEKNDPVSVDVTKLVKKMLLSSNNGFLISPESSFQEFMASGQLFASPKYDFEEFHPLLIINYEYRLLNDRPKYYQALSGQSMINEQQRLIQMNKWLTPTTTNSSPPTQPVKEQVITPHGVKD